MKKNKLFLLGLFVVFAAVLSLSLVSNTLAKYTTSDNGSDTARVAKWGVNVTVDGDETAITEINGSAEAHVITNTGEKLAPGTAGQLLEVTVSGTPEVAVEVTYKATVTLTGWEVAGSYYFPVVVKVDGTAVTISDQDADSDVDAVDAEKCIKAAIEACTATYDAGDALTAEEVVITWEWAFSTSDENDVKDTALGDAAPAPSISIELTCTVTQVE